MQEHYADELLSAYLDGDLGAEASDAIKRHLANCVTCRQVLEELGAIRSVAASLEELEPSELVTERIRFRCAQRFRTGRTAKTRLFWVFPSVAAAAAVLLVAFLVARRGVQTPESVGRPVSERGTDDKVLVAGAAREYEEYLRGIAEAVDDCEHALRENPGNPRVRLAYLNARSSQIEVADRFLSGGD